MKAMATSLFSAAVLVATVVITAPSLAAEDEGHHRHHVAVSGGLAKNDSKTSGFVGVDYFYRFGEHWAAGVFLKKFRGTLTLGYWDSRLDVISTVGGR